MGFACVSRMFRDVSRVSRTIVVHDVGGGLRVSTAPLKAKTAFSKV